MCACAVSSTGMKVQELGRELIHNTLVGNTANHGKAVVDGFSLLGQITS